MIRKMSLAHRPHKVKIMFHAYHLNFSYRDARRLIVALSRARLGLYILARVSLFERCYELRHAFKRLLERPTQLLLLPNESFDMQNPRQPNDPLTCEPTKIVDTSHISHFVGEFYNSNLELLKHRHMIENAHFYTKQTDEETRRPEKDVRNLLIS